MDDNKIQFTDKELRRKWQRFCGRVRVKSWRPNYDADRADVRHVVLADGRCGYWCPCHGFERYKN